MLCIHKTVSGASEEMGSIAENIIIAFIMGLRIFTIINNLKAVKFSNKRMLLCIFGNMMIALFGIYTDKFLILPFSIIFTIMFLGYINKSIYNSIIVLIIMYSIAALSDIITAAILLNFLKPEYFFIRNSVWGGMSLYFLLLLFSYLISKGIYIIFFREKIEIQNLKKGTFKKNIILLIYSSLSLCLIYLNGVIYKWFFFGKYNRVVSIHMVFIALYFILGILTIYFSNENNKRQMEHDNTIKEFKQLKEYTDTIENIIDESKKFRHDYINILSTINGYIQDRDLNGLEKYFGDEILQQSLIMKNNKYTSLQNLKISGLKGLISSKITKASALNLETNTEIIEVIEDIAVNNLDMARILGILLDNAIESAALTKDKKLNIVIMKNENCIIFIISNSFLGDISSINRLYKKGFSTKGENRGLGLSIVNDIIKEYPNILLNTEVENNLFKQELLVCNKNKHRI